MKRAATPYVENLNIATAGLADCNRVLMEAEVNGGESARQAKALAGQLVAGAFAQIKAAARRYMGEQEYANAAAPQPILGDAHFRAAAVECSDLLEKAAPTVGVVCERAAAALRVWVVDRKAQEAATLVAISEAGSKIAKMLGARAA